MTVTPAALTITAVNATKAYGAALPTPGRELLGLRQRRHLGQPHHAADAHLDRNGQQPRLGQPVQHHRQRRGRQRLRHQLRGRHVSPSPRWRSSITANDQSKVYGAALPTLTASYSGLVNGDTSASLTTQPALTTTATASSHVSGNPYSITASGAADSDYTISYVAGTLTVTPAALTITANNQSKVYGAAVPALSASYAGFVNGDTSASLTVQPTLSTTATTHSHVSGNPYSITASGAADSDYSISYVNGTLTVTPAALTITAVNKTKAYGAALPALDGSLTRASSTATPRPASPSSRRSPRPPRPAAMSPAARTPSPPAARWMATTASAYVAGTLTVTPVALTITAVNKTKVYGAALPTLTASYSGFVNGDSSASLTTQPTLTTTATASSHVSGSPYSITASGAVDTDYTISYVAGTLTVTKAPLTITAVNQTKVYGARAAGTDGHLQRLRQWRHLGQLDDPADARHDGHGQQPCLGQPLHHHRQRRGRHRLLDQLRVRLAYRHPGAARHHR